jgi:hypothetical protein
MFTLTSDPQHVVGVHVVYPLAGALPDDSPNPKREIGRHQMDEAKPKETILLYTYSTVYYITNNLLVFFIACYPIYSDSPRKSSNMALLAH